MEISPRRRIVPAIIVVVGLTACAVVLGRTLGAESTSIAAPPLVRTNPIPVTMPSVRAGEVPAGERPSNGSRPPVRPVTSGRSTAQPENRRAVPAGRVPRATPSPPKRQALKADGFEGDSLPVDSPFDLPPIVQIRVRSDATGVAEHLRRTVLKSPRLALTPAVRRGIRSGGASSQTLHLLLDLEPADAPLLVYRARGRSIRVQATSLRATRTLLRTIRSAGVASVRLRPVRRSFADVTQAPIEARGADIGAIVVGVALAQVGLPYSWGGGNASGASTGTCAGYSGSIQPCPATRTVGFDCSGLTLYAYAQVGISLDHYAAFQWLEGRRIAAADLMPGDLVFFHPKADGPGHMGMYVGSGRFVHAPQTGDVVKVSDLADYAGSYMGAVRPY